MKLHAPAFAIACGVLCAVSVFLWTWWMLIFGTAAYGDQTLIGTVYLGYTVSGAGSVIGLVWGLVDGLIGGAIFATVYNKLVDRLGSGLASPVVKSSPPRASSRASK